MHFPFSLGLCAAEFSSFSWNFIIFMQIPFPPPVQSDGIRVKKIEIASQKQNTNKNGKVGTMDWRERVKWRWKSNAPAWLKLSTRENPTCIQYMHISGIFIAGEKMTRVYRDTVTNAMHTYVSVCNCQWQTKSQKPEQKRLMIFVVVICFQLLSNFCSDMQSRYERTPPVPQTDLVYAKMKHANGLKY